MVYHGKSESKMDDDRGGYPMTQERKIYMISDNGHIGNPPEKGNIIDCMSIVDFSYWPSRAV